MGMQIGANTGGAAVRIPSQSNYNSFSFLDLHRVVCLKSFLGAERSRFACHLALFFPAAAARIDENDFGVLHLEVGALKLETRDAIAKHDWNTVVEHYAFVSELMFEAGAELRDAIEVSYLGSLFYGETALSYAKARALLPKRLAAVLGKVEKHYEDMVP